MEKVSELHKVAVVGAGTMGQGIAQVAAMAGYQVILYDINSDMLAQAREGIAANLDQGIAKGKVDPALKEATLSRLTISDQFMEVTGDLIIEAVVERLDVKRNLFAELESINGPGTLYASNTSSIPITRIAAKLDHPENLCGLHFFNPAHIMKLVEVISGEATDPQVISKVHEFTESLGKIPVNANDSPGFIVNRVARHFYLESLNILEEQVASAEGIDRLLEATGFPMGPFRLMDLIGIDTNYAVTDSLFKAFHYEPRFRPSRVQQQKMESGHWGKKSGKGFYDYQD